MIEGFDRVDMNSNTLGDKFRLSGFTEDRVLIIHTGERKVQ